MPAQPLNSDDIDDDAEFCSLDLGGGGGGGGRGRRRQQPGGNKNGRPNFGGGGEVFEKESNWNYRHTCRLRG